MVPRVDITMCEDTDKVEEVMAVMRRTGFSRLPIFHEDQDNVVGIAHIKDLLEPMMSGDEDDRVKKYMRDATFVPDTKDILPLLSEMQNAHEQIVVVVDEYGGTAGIITIEDIVEEIVGEIEDEFDPDNKYLTRLSRREWLVDGRFPCDDAVDLAGLSRRATTTRRLPDGFWICAILFRISARSLKLAGTSLKFNQCAVSASRWFA